MDALEFFKLGYVEQMINIVHLICRRDCEQHIEANNSKLLRCRVE